MKKSFFLMLAIVFSATIAVAAKAATTPRDFVLKTFHKDFVGVSNTNWSEDADYYYVSFQLNGEPVRAVYTKTEADFVGYARFTIADRLPLLARNILKNNFDGYTVTGKVLEIGYETSVAYEFTAENEKEILHLRLQDGNINVIKRLRKI